MARLTREQLLEWIEEILEASDGIEYGYLQIGIEQRKISNVDGYRRKRTVHDGRKVKKPKE